MKGKFSAAQYWSAVLLAFVISTGAVLCPITAFPLAYHVTFLLLICALSALLLPLLFYIPMRKLTWCLFWLCLLLAGYLLRKELWEGLRYTVLVVSTRYSQAYNEFTVLRLGGPDPVPEDCTWLFAFLGVLTSLCLCWTVMRRQTAFPTFAIVVLALIPCVVDLSSFPDTLPLFLLLGGALLLALSQGSRRCGSGDDGLTLYLALPVACLLAVLLFLFPRSSYERTHWSDTLQERTTDALARLPFLTVVDDQLVFSPMDLHFSSETAVVNLRAIGPQVQTGQEVMSVRSETGGRLYLRGASLGDYTGTSWEPVSDSAHRKAGLSQWDADPFWELEEKTSMDIRTEIVSKVLYTPYDTARVLYDSDSEGVSHIWDGTPHYDAYYPNGQEFSAYTAVYSNNRWDPTDMDYSYLPVLNYLDSYISTSFDDIDSWMNGRLYDILSGSSGFTLNYDSMLDWYTQNEAYTAFAEENYTQLPQSTRQALEEILEESGIRQVTGEALGIPTRAAQAFAVADFVRSSANYSLRTSRMPLGQDFVLWFLRDSDTGYCVHFASATVTLLRALDIPARYVTGYTVTARPGQWTTVTTNDAHAWAEFYLPGMGWVPLESTPGSGSDSPGAPRPTVSTAEPAPTSPAETTEPSPSVTGPSPTMPDVTTPSQVPSAASDPPTSGSTPGNIPGASSQEAKPSLVIPWGSIFKVLGTVLAPVLLLVLYRCTVLLVRGRSLKDPDLNRRAVALYLRLEKTAKSAKVPVPEELTALAKRARFSQHTFTRAELQPLNQFHHTLVSTLKARPWYRRFWDRWIRVLY